MPSRFGCVQLFVTQWTVAHQISASMGFSKKENLSEQNHPKDKVIHESKVVIWGGFTNIWEKKRSERQGRMEKIYPTEYRVPENSKESLEAFLNE